MLSETGASPNYSTMFATTSQFHAASCSDREFEHEEHANIELQVQERQPWFGKRAWMAIRQWEQEHVELVLENKQSVARDHLGAFILLTN